MVAALPPAFTKRFGEIVWAQGGAGFGWWPSCIYDPRLTVGGARKLALKNIGKKHLTYFFGCHDAPFTVLSDNKCLAWEEGLLEEYDLGKTAKAIGKTRALMFEWALQAATAENEKPIEYRLDWNHEEDATVIAAGKPQGQRSSNSSISKPRTSTGTGTGISGKRISPIGGEKAKKKKAVTNSKENNSEHANLSVTSSGHLHLSKASSSASTPDAIQPTRRSIRERKPSARSHEDLLSISSQPAMSPTAVLLVAEKDTPTRSGLMNFGGPKSTTRSSLMNFGGPKSSPASKSPGIRNFEIFCKICRNDQVLESSFNDASAFISSSNAGFVTLPSSSSSTFADARSIMVRDLDEDCLPYKWKFFVPYLGPMSVKQEVRYGSMLQFLNNTTHGEQFGDGTAKSPLRVFIYECK